MNKQDKILIVGRFGAPFGVKGWVKVFSYTDPIENLISYLPWHAQIQDKWQPLEILETRKHHQTFVVSIKDCISPEQAGQYRNIHIGIFRSQLPKLDKEVYWSDLEGLVVSTVDGRTLGTVQSIFATGANDVLVVKDTEHKELLIPFLRDTVIKDIDLEKGTLLVDWDFE